MIRVLLSVLLMITFLPINPVFAETLGRQFTIGIQSTKTLSIRPFEAVERDMLSVYNAVYESLVFIDDDYMPQGLLAESWEQSNNGKVWTFTLRNDIRFSDGTPITAYDVVSSAQYILDKANDENIADHGFYYNLGYFVKSISAKDDKTVIVKAKRPYWGILYEMTFPVVPADQVNQDQPIGSGPYVISSFDPGSYLMLETNKNWWKAQSPQVEEIRFSFSDTPRIVIENYEYGRVQAVFTRSIASTQYKTGMHSVTMSYRTNQLDCLFMNNTVSELTPEVRKAIRYVIDKQKIIDSVYSGLAKYTNFPFYPGTWMYNESLDPSYSVNLDEARRLLAEAGWEDSDENGILDRTDAEGKVTNLHLRFYVYEEPDNDVRVEAANMIADQLAQVGISTKVEAMTMANAKEKLRAGSFDLVLGSFAMDVCPDPGFILIRGNTGNYCRYKSSRMTELCEQLRKEYSYQGYRQRLMEIQSLFTDDCPFICLYYRMGNVLSRYMYTTCRDVREYELLRGIESYELKE
ncbi:MAG: ABC transporter substrate-binding protein [Clostridia bacterium]|nr:ABC transporter substrate-binding protein [Clostridia bacterium]